jgi:hypothetical protein
MLEKLEKEKLLAIFNSLDSDKDGFISSVDIDISGLSLQLLEIFNPTLKDMEDKSAKLNVEEFMEVALKRYKTLTTYDKKAVLDFNKKFRSKEDIEHPSFTVYRLCSLL